MGNCTHTAGIVSPICPVCGSTRFEGSDELHLVWSFPALFSGHGRAGGFPVQWKVTVSYETTRRPFPPRFFRQRQKQKQRSRTAAEEGTGSSRHGCGNIPAVDGERHTSVNAISEFSSIFTERHDYCTTRSMYTTIAFAINTLIAAMLSKCLLRILTALLLLLRQSPVGASVASGFQHIPTESTHAHSAPSQRARHQILAYYPGVQTRATDDHLLSPRVRSLGINSYSGVR